jgi:hypothetical protein
MTAKPAQMQTHGQGAADALKSWMMVILTLGFVLLYGAALVGWIKPLSDDKMVARLEPFIFVIIGYYFGRLPSQQTEGTLKDEINRQTQKADAAQHAKEQAQQTREALEEKVKNVRAALSSAAPAGGAKTSAEHFERATGAIKEDALRQSVVAALNIVNS